MEITKGKITALIVALGVLVSYLIHYGAFNSMWLGLYLLFPLSLICFPDEIGAITGNLGRGFVTHPSPGFLVSAMGWVILIGISILAFLGKR